MKGQAALEFLMTYGWAVIIVVVVVAALFAMNIFNPSAFMPEDNNVTEDNNAVKCFETATLTDVSEHCNTTCTCDIVCLGLDNGTVKR